MRKKEFEMDVPKVNDHHKTIESWGAVEDMYGIIAAILEPLDIFVEVGCWKGGSFCYMGKLLLEQQKNVAMYAVDLWAGENMSGHMDEQKLTHEKVLNEFRSNVKKQG